MDPYYPSRTWWSREILLAISIVLISSPLWLLSPILGSLFSTLFLPLFRALRTGHVRPDYYRDPSACRVAIIGAGWTGLAIAARLRDLGVAFQGFETADDVGGTWHPQRRYADLRLHTPAYGAAFAHFPCTEVADGERPDGATLHGYMRRFAHAHGLRHYFCFGSRVTAVAYDARARTATLTVARPEPPAAAATAATQHPTKATTEEWGPFDLVIYASVAAKPHVPTLQRQVVPLNLAHQTDRGGTFRSGATCHACELTAERIAAIVESKQRVTVAGAGKSACDVIQALVAGGVPPDKLTWLARRPYYFYKFERMFHRDLAEEPSTTTATAAAASAGSKLSRVARAWGAAIAMGLCISFPKLGWRLLWALDFVYCPFADGEVDADKWDGSPPFHMGILDAKQRYVCHEPNGYYTLRLRDEPMALESSELTLKSGDKIGCDCLVWATGFETGASEIQLTKRGPPQPPSSHQQRNGDGGSASAGEVETPFTLNPDAPLFEHCICPDFPCLALPAHFFVTAGPGSAYEAAEYLVYHLCVRQPLSEALMSVEANAQWCEQSTTKHLLFAPGFWRAQMLIQMDLINAGILPMWVGVIRLFEFWVCNRLPPRELGLLPRAGSSRCVPVVWTDALAACAALCGCRRVRSSGRGESSQEEQAQPLL